MEGLGAPGDLRSHRDEHSVPTSSILPMQHLAHPALESRGTRCVLGDTGKLSRMLHLPNAKFLLERAINVVKTQ